MVAEDELCLCKMRWECPEQREALIPFVVSAWLQNWPNFEPWLEALTDGTRICSLFSHDQSEPQLWPGMTPQRFFLFALLRCVIYFPSAVLFASPSVVLFGPQFILFGAPIQNGRGYLNEVLAREGQNFD